MKRTQKSIINVIASVGTNAIILITAFIVQKALVSTMGGDYNGINGLFSSIISMMSLADLGIGTAIIYHMYQPVAERDTAKINTLLHFYKKCYIVISGVVLLIGIGVGLFLPMLVGDVEIPDSIYLIYVLFLDLEDLGLDLLFLQLQGLCTLCLFFHTFSGLGNI